MTSLLLLGLFLGMRHALEADHVAALASLATRSSSIGYTIKQGVVWGLGHTVALFLFSSLILLTDNVIAEHLAQVLEVAVGVMLLILGIDIVRRLIKNRIHFHSHLHGEKLQHFHAHSHAGEKKDKHNPSQHEHEHPKGFPVRALFVGLMHGMAGSAALIILSLQTINSPQEGLLYILLFGIGSIFGMALLSVIIAIPLRHSAKGLTWIHNGLQLIISVITIIIGIGLLYDNGDVFFS